MNTQNLIYDARKCNCVALPPKTLKMPPRRALQSAHKREGVRFKQQKSCSINWHKHKTFKFWWVLQNSAWRDAILLWYLFVCRSTALLTYFRWCKRQANENQKRVTDCVLIVIIWVMEFHCLALGSDTIAYALTATPTSNDLRYFICCSSSWRYFTRNRSLKHY